MFLRTLKYSSVLTLFSLLGGKLFTVGNTKDLAKFNRGRCSQSRIARECGGVCACVLGRGVLQPCKDGQSFVYTASQTPAKPGT